jgi:8-hydroxy-5-deazaflavin:NADPH oxidoreductase
MKITVLGTGAVGQAQAAKLAELGHDVVMGTRDVQKKMNDSEGRAPFAPWIKQHPKVKLATLAEAAKHGELIIEALHGQTVVEELKNLAEDLKGKVLIDISNPLDFSKGMPPSLFICNTDSLAEQIQAALPDVKIVKAFNTTNATVQTEPQKLAGGDHHLFICGNDAEAKKQTTEIAQSYGWKNIIDLGDLKSARGMEMILPIWVQLMGTLKTPAFNFKIAQ